MIFFQEASYDAYSNGFTVTKNRLSSYVIKENFCACDGNRVWAKDYEGYLATNPKVTTYIGNYYEVQVEGYVQPTGGTPTQPCTPAYCAYFPCVNPPRHKWVTEEGHSLWASPKGKLAPAVKRTGD